MSAQLGLVRNRTDKFLSYRKAAVRGGRLHSPRAAEGDAGAKLLEVAIDAAGIAASLPPRWVDITSEVQEEVKTIRSKMNELKTIYGKTLLTTFDDQHPDEASIEVITADVTRRFRRAQGRLKILNEVPGSADDVKVRTNVQRSLAMDLSQLSMEFRKQQKAYLGKMQKNKDGGILTQDPLDQHGGGSSWKWSDDDEDQGMSTAQIEVIDNMDTLVAERDSEITKVVQSIQDLAQIMQDLSVMVIDQGTILDRIDYNMEQVSMKIDEGVKQLVKAEKKQKGSCRIMCIGVLFVAVLLMLIILVLKNVF